MAEAVAEDYRSSLADLSFNSKPHINMLTMLAEDNVQYAPLIVDTIISHIKGVPPDLKLPSLYLVDSIMKNIGGKYIAQFSKHMIELFSSVFEKVDEATRSALYKLRQTWNDILPKPILYGIDCRVNSIDPAWPITAQVTAKSIHVNPKFVSGTGTQAVQNLVKESEIKKKQDEMKKMIEEKNEREKMLRLIEEKRAQLRILEAKKLEQLQRAKQKGLETVLLKHKVQNNITHRDPRLKKAAAFIAETEKLQDKQNPSSLQSVVVVPSADSKSTDVAKTSSKTSSNNDHGTATPVSKSSPTESKLELQIDQCENLTITEQTIKSAKICNKKRTLSPEESNLSPEFIKKPCKDHNFSLNNSKNLVQNSELIQNIKKENSEIKTNDLNVNQQNNASNDIFKEKDKTQFVQDQGLPQNSLFLGSEDKDYRKIPRDISNIKKEIPHSINTKNFGTPFYQNEVPTNSMSEERSGGIKEQLLHMPAEKVQMKPQPAHLPSLDTAGKYKDLLKPISNEDATSTIVPRKGSPIPFTQSFKLDGKDRIIHFVDKRAFAFMDDNEPHELSFIGPPKNVFVEGLTQPFLLGFDSKSKEFEVDGKKNSIQFGTPSRELYINNIPHEAQFGGPPLVAILQNNKRHRIGIDGPSPQVLISEKPAFELFEAFNRRKSDTSCQPTVSQKNVKIEDATLPIQDVDMRLKNNPLKPPAFFESTSKQLKDVDWRQVPISESHQPPWNVPQNLKSHISSVDNSVSSVMSNAPFGPSERFPTSSSVFVCIPASISRPGDVITSMATQSVESIASKSIPVPNIPWTEPNFKCVRPSFETPSLKTTSFQETKSHQIGPLLPPPSLPPSLSTLPPPPPLPNLPPVDVRPATWQPLPPPPMFAASVPIPNRTKVPLLPTPLTAPLNFSEANITNPIKVQEKQPEPPPSLGAPIDVGSIFAKLVAAGIISKKTEDSDSTDGVNKSKDTYEECLEDSSKERKVFPHIEFKTKSLKKFHPMFISVLYEGSQCATCGLRFKNSQGEQYGRHLDWHFRMNRREKDGVKKAFSRKYFYGLKDWKQFAEIEEAEERAPSYFELQADGVTLKKEEVEKIHSVRASECETEKCSVCGEQFQLFWVEEEEEWHLRHAVRHDGEAYHPACYEDFVKASKSPTVEAELSKEEISETEIKDSPEKMEVDDLSPVKAEDNVSMEDVPIEEEPVHKELASEESNAVSDIIDAIVNEEKKSIVKEESVEEEEPSELTTEDVESGKSEIIIYMTDELLSEEEMPEINSEAAPEDVQKDSEEKPNVTVNLPEIVTEATEVSLPKSEADVESEGEEEFRPPTPDPRFEVLPPTFKGTELSALCTIM